jgi:hypothetical protein
MWRSLRPKLGIGSIINKGNQDINNQYVSGSGVGAMPTSVRRALKRRASKTCCDLKAVSETRRSVDPVESVGSITFNGVDQYVSAPNARVTTWLPGTGDFTVEWFMKKGGDSSFPRVFALGYDTTATLGCSIEGGICYIWPYGYGLNAAMPAEYESGANWIHVAVCRSSGVTQLFLNGVSMASVSDSSDITDAINPGFDLNIGVDDPLADFPNWWAGTLTNFRWTNSAVYTSDFTVPSAPLAQLPATKLLLLGGTLSNPVYDSTTENVLVNHGAVWNAATPFV